MNTHPYLEQYLDNLESLPPELSRNFKLIHDLDIRVRDILIEIDKLKADFLGELKTMDNETRQAKQKVISAKYEKCREFSDEKVQLANQTYELVDKHIRRLDTDLARFEAEIKERSLQRGEKLESLDETSQLSVSIQHNTTLTSDKVDSSKRKKKKNENVPVVIEENKPVLPISSLALTLAQPADVLDMPVDPNEPTYCICHQVSYGEMIGCDNMECPVEWFHFGCVGLTSKPKGKWYCPACTEKRKANK